MGVARARWSSNRVRVGSVCAVIVAAGLAVTFPVPVWATGVAVLVLVAVAIVSSRTGDSATADAACSVALLWMLIRLPFVGLWPIPAGLAVVGAVLVAARQGRLHRWRSWFRRGRVDRVSWVIVVAIAVITAAALLLWHAIMASALPQAYGHLLESVPSSVAAVFLGLFLIANGAVEDTLWSGLLLTAGERAMPVPAAVAVTALSFALAHLHGVPGGPIGLIMVLLWGIALALLRLRTRGMLATYVAHVAADIVIAVMLGAFALVR